MNAVPRNYSCRIEYDIFADFIPLLSTINTITDIAQKIWYIHNPPTDDENSADQHTYSAHIVNKNSVAMFFMCIPIINVAAAIIYYNWYHYKDAQLSTNVSSQSQSLLPDDSNTQTTAEESSSESEDGKKNELHSKEEASNISPLIGAHLSTIEPAASGPREEILEHTITEKTLLEEGSINPSEPQNKINTTQTQEDPEEQASNALRDISITEVDQLVEQNFHMLPTTSHQIRFQLQFLKILLEKFQQSPPSASLQQALKATVTMLINKNKRYNQQLSTIIIQLICLITDSEAKLQALKDFNRTVSAGDCPVLFDRPAQDVSTSSTPSNTSNTSVRGRGRVRGRERGGLAPQTKTNDRKITTECYIDRLSLPEVMLQTVSNILYVQGQKNSSKLSYSCWSNAKRINGPASF